MWTHVTADLAESSLTRQQQAWVRLTQPVVLIDDTFIIAAPDKFARQAFETKLRNTLNDAISRRVGRPAQIAVTVQKSTNAPASAGFTAPVNVPAQSPSPSSPPPNNDSSGTTASTGSQLSAAPVSPAATQPAAEEDLNAGQPAAASIPLQGGEPLGSSPVSEDLAHETPADEAPINRVSSEAGAGPYREPASEAPSSPAPSDPSHRERGSLPPVSPPATTAERPLPGELPAPRHESERRTSAEYRQPDTSGTTHGAYEARQNGRDAFADADESFGHRSRGIDNDSMTTGGPTEPQQPPSLFDTAAIAAMGGTHASELNSDESDHHPDSQTASDYDFEDAARQSQQPATHQPPVAPPPSADPDPNRTGSISGGKHSAFTKVENPVGAGMSRLNPRYNFDTFVIGSSNRFAHAAAVAVSEAPARAYNPLFVYGGSGLGKTHLLHAIGHYSHKLGHASVVRYVSTEEFTNDFINSLHDKRPQAFQRRYRDVDILLIDDIQFLERAERTQEEFFHTFNTLHNANKQIVISSDRSPKQLQTLEDRLRTRFEWGLLADIQPPDLETRIAILQKKAAQDELSVPFAALEFIASQIHHSIRELEGALIRVTAYASLNQKPVDVSLAQEVLRDFIPEGEAPEVTVDQIVQASADYFGVSAIDLKGNSRSRVLVSARQVAMYLCRELTDLSLPRIGQAFGGRDHTTVMHANRKIRKQMAERRALYNQIAELTNRLKQQGN
ncbi:chromosomal replication initiator protein DnaA [Natronoglycomyces albus]|uniref:Chromosomal replication initiator protein DnaA n=1 Tax=Natronoglycomyces albus TaxID=2811108 RepID=A0A895XN94_9ACTN|nr:chromosomal replication initiator protein DnaA [Natronoglycomyces albus]